MEKPGRGTFKRSLLMRVTGDSSSVAAPHRWLKNVRLPFTSKFLLNRLNPAKWSNVWQGKYWVGLILLNGMWIDETHHHLSIFVASASGFWTLASWGLRQGSGGCIPSLYAWHRTIAHSSLGRRESFYRTAKLRWFAAPTSRSFGSGLAPNMSIMSLASKSTRCSVWAKL